MNARIGRPLRRNLRRILALAALAGCWSSGCLEGCEIWECDETRVCTGRVGETRCVDGKLQRCLPADYFWFNSCDTDLWSRGDYCEHEDVGGLAAFPLECATGADGVGFCREVGASACSEPEIRRCDGVTITLCDSGFIRHIEDCTSRDPDGVCLELGDDSAICTYAGSYDCDPDTFGVNDGLVCEGDWLIGCDATRHRTVRRHHCKRDDPDGVCLELGDDQSICTYAGSSDCDPETFGVQQPFLTGTVGFACEDDRLIYCSTFRRTVRLFGSGRCVCSCPPDAPDPIEACADTSCHDENADATDGPGT